MPPVATRRFFPKNCWPFSRVRVKCSGEEVIAATGERVSQVTPARRAELVRHSMIVSERLVVGKRRPSASAMRATPRSANHETVSAGWNREKGPMRFLKPRG